MSRLLPLVMWAVLCMGCGSGTRIYVRSTDSSNNGNTMYMLVRSVDPKTVRTDEPYTEVAAKVFADPADESVLMSQPIFPGNPVTLDVSHIEAKDIVVYFLFTDPGQDWRLPLRAPLPSEVYVDLGDNEIQRVRVRK